WAQHYQTIDKTGHHQDYQNLTLAHVWLKQANYEAVLALLEQLIARAQPAGRTSTVLEAQMLRALASQAAGALEPALAALEQILPLARQQSFVRPFLNAGPPMMKLLRSAVERGICPDDAAHLLDRAQSSGESQHPADSLTEREIEVLQLIAGGASNQNIADTLVLSVGTVKSHIHHIMNKLDAQNRTEAVSKARSLRILPD
ncbi:MAG: LuxR C-terminal-related transcriptional regulator, partial [Phototrophicaceae bacterium]